MNAQLPMAPLREHPFVAGLTPPQVEKLVALGRMVRFAKDEVIYREGEEYQDFYLVVSGRVVLEITPPSGAFHVDIVEPGEVFGWSALLRGGERVLQSRALQETVVVAFDGDRLRELCESDTALGVVLMQKLLAVSVDRLQALRIQVMDASWPVARRAGA